MNNTQIQALIKSEIQKVMGNKTGTKKLSQSDWIVTRHKEQQELGIATSLSEADYISLLEYRQQRRELVE